jgi:glycosyltransferase involved in cell wall biosynthesis
MLDHGFLRRGGLRHRGFRWLERLIDRLPSVIVPSGPAARAFLLKRGTDPDKVRLVEDAVDIAHLQPERHTIDRTVVRHALGIPDNAPVVVYLGLLADYQGIPLLIDAVRHLLCRRPDAYAVIAGFPGVDYYSAMAADMPVAGHVLFPGRIPYSDAPALLAAGDVAVAPKLSMTEGNGKILNYMAMELPVVAINTPANRAMLGDQGRFVAPDDPAAFAEQIECAFDEPAHVREALRARVLARYSWDQQVCSLEEIYAELLGLDPAIANTRQSREATIGSDT